MNIIINDIIQACQERIDFFIVMIVYAVIVLVIVIMIIIEIAERIKKAFDSK